MVNQQNLLAKHTKLDSYQFKNIAQYIYKTSESRNKTHNKYLSMITNREKTYLFKETGIS